MCYLWPSRDKRFHLVRVLYRLPAIFSLLNDVGNVCSGTIPACTLGGVLPPPGSEAERRISFFAQSLTTNIPPPLPVDAMPTFTVLTPHYSEKVIPKVFFLIEVINTNYVVSPDATFSA